MRSALVMRSAPTGERPRGLLVALANERVRFKALDTVALLSTTAGGYASPAAVADARPFAESVHAGAGRLDAVSKVEGYILAAGDDDRPRKRR